MPRAARDDALRRLARGEIDLIAGTHALLEPDVRFRKLALVIVDEQHRFGVSQRSRLREKGACPHYLVMTATPIPRTLAMTLYGDLDVTVIDELPPGRQPIATRIVGASERERAAAWGMVRGRLAEGEQAYVVYPLVEESDTLDLKAATVEVEALRAGALAGFNVGLLHGRMNGQEKTRIIDEFRSGRMQALVSTTVIEVGVDVPAATVMVIEHAERYGLSQLHQLRGRVGRGAKPSCCLLMTDTQGENVHERLAVICGTTDGFRIAEADLKLRGPGELLGTRQHGLPVFKAANLVDDLDLITAARDDAADLLRGDPELILTDHRALRAAIHETYGGFLEITTNGRASADSWKQSIVSGG
jgi:ATP-dependent DNA helicase RecG